jgi:uncharacterized protein with HEPN domain
MSDRDDNVYLRHIMDTAREIVRKLEGRTRDEFDADVDFRFALTYRVQIIGEAASRLSPTFRDTHAEIPWHRLIGMRYRIVHDYMNINDEILWEVVTRSVAELVELLEPLVPPDQD